MRPQLFLRKTTYLFMIAVFGMIIISCNKSTEKYPNIVYILADDMGYGDVSALNENSKIQTKYIDQLAKEGISFTDAHSGSSVCTPTRYGILTGRYSWRSILKKGVTWSYDKHVINPDRMTVASMLKSKGYKTGAVGKWHLGLDWDKDESGIVNLKGPIKNGPNELGFEYFYGIAASLDIPPYVYIQNDYATATEIDTIEKMMVWVFGEEDRLAMILSTRTSCLN